MKTNSIKFNYKNNQLYFYISLITAILLICIFGYLLVVNKYNPNTSNYKNDTETNSELNLIEISEFWGPCPRFSGPCSQKTELKSSGILKFSGSVNKQIQLNETQVNQIILDITNTNILTKNCNTEPLVLDYGANYKFNFNNQQKEINFPNCQSELEQVGRIIGALINSK